MTDRIKELLASPGFRASSVGAVDKENRTVDLSFSSEAEVPLLPGIIEALSHDPGACDLSLLNDGASLLFNHDRDQQLGVIESAKIDPDRTGRAAVRFGSSAVACDHWPDVQNGVLSKISVGYRRLEVKLTEERQDADVYTVTRWQPYEISFVTIPADTTVGVARSANINPTKDPNFMPELVEPPAPAKPPVIELGAEAIRSQANLEGQARVKAILDASKAYNLPELGERALRDGMSMEQFREAALDEIGKRNAKVADASRPIGMGEKEARSFSVLRLLRAIAPEEGMAKRAREEASFELDACRATADQVTHRAVSGCMIPVDVMLAGTTGMRDGTISIASGTGYTGTGGAAVATTLLGGSFIDVLRNKTTLLRMATPLGGLIGNITIPKQLNTTTGFWVGEAQDVGKSSLDLGLLTLSPNTVGSYVDITRRFLMQNSIGAEAVIRNDMLLALGLMIDKTGYYGPASSTTTPCGITNASAITPYEFAAANPTYAELVDMETKVSQLNADVASMRYVVNPSTRGYAKTTLKFPLIQGAGGTITQLPTGGPIWEPGDTMNGYGAEVTNQINIGDVFFGNFADFWVGMWGGLEVLTDPFANGLNGGVRVITHQDMNFLIRRPQSFVYGTH